MSGAGCEEERGGPCLPEARHEADPRARAGRGGQAGRRDHSLDPLVPAGRRPPEGAEGVAKTDDQGNFRVELTFYYGRSYSLCALDTERKRGGLAVVGPKTPDEAITIQAGPLVHVHGKYTCKELDQPVGWTNSMFLSMPERWRINEHMTKNGEFSVLLPPGRYLLQGYGGPDVEQIAGT